MHAIHESQTLRIERVHETPAHETAWTVAAYEKPVSDRMWVLTATGATPAPVLQDLLIHLAEGDGWDTVIGAPVDERMVASATQRSSTPDGSTPWAGDGSAGRPPTGTRASSSTPSPHNMRVRTWPPGPSGPALVRTGPPGPSPRPRTLRVHCWRVSLSPSPRRPARARPSWAASTGPASPPVRQRLRRSRPADPPAVRVDKHRAARWQLQLHASRHSLGAITTASGTSLIGTRKRHSSPSSGCWGRCVWLRVRGGRRSSQPRRRLSRVRRKEPLARGGWA